MDDQCCTCGPCCNPDCHRLERVIVLTETERIVRVRLDGDPVTIATIIQALHDDLPDAA